VMADKMMLFR